MRTVIGCLAVIGLVTLLVVGGCAGLISFGVAKVLEPMPSYATKSDISRRHAADLRLIQTALSEGNLPAVEKSLSADVLAVFRERHGGESPAAQDILERHTFTAHSWRVINGAGVGTLTAQGRTLDCEIISLDDPRGSGDDLLVFFVDHQIGAVERQ